MLSQETVDWFNELDSKPITDVHTRGNIIVNHLKVGDIHYEYDYGRFIKSRVLTEPLRNEEGYWTWKAQHILPSGEDGMRVIQYGVHENYTHYASKLYDHEAYGGCKQV